MASFPERISLSLVGWRTLTSSRSDSLTSPTPDSTTLCLSFQGVSWGPPEALKIGDAPIVEDLNLDIPQGCWVSLTGPSGAGKTTVLSLGAGLLSPQTGEVKVFGQSLQSLCDHDLSRLRNQRVGMIFQNYQLDDCRNVEENILLPAYFSECRWHDARERARLLASRLGLESYLAKPVSVLSGGQRQRVAVCRSLILNPDLLLADEPTGALDEDTAQDVLELLGEEVEGGMALLCVTHNQQVLQKSSVRYHFQGRKLRRLDP